MRGQAVVGSGLYGQPYTSGAALLAESDSFCNIAGGVSRQGIMQIAHKVVPVVQWQRHEGPPHQDELHLQAPCMIIWDKQVAPVRQVCINDQAWPAESASER